MSTVRVPLSIRRGHRLAPEAAASWERARPAVEALMGGRTWVPTDTDRPIEVQERIFLDRYKPQSTGGGAYGDVRWWRGVRYVRRPGTAMAAVPGTSNHGRGTAVDCGAPWNTWDRDRAGHKSPRRRAFEAVMRENGWTFPISSEAWHAEYNPARDTRRGNPVPFWHAIQRAMQAAGHRLAVDGLPGAQTMEELRRFQAARGLVVDGVPGPATLAALGLTTEDLSADPADHTALNDSMRPEDEMVVMVSPAGHCFLAMPGRALAHIPETDTLASLLAAGARRVNVSTQMLANLGLKGWE